MLAVTVTEDELRDLYPVFKRIRATFSTGIPFYNTLTMRVEVATTPMKGIYPPSILLYGNINTYQPVISHTPFTESIGSSPTLRDYQIPIFRTVMNHYNQSVSKNQPCVVHIQAPCGFGKSETSLKIITSLKIKTVIIVKTKILVNHWCCYFERCGINHLGSYEGATNLLKTLVEQQLPDVLIIVSRHVENEEFVEFLQLNYSFCLIDEIHSWSLTNHSEISKFLITKPFPVNVYLTATPNKQDLSALGKIIKADHPPSFHNLQREIVVYSLIDKNIVSVEEPSTDEPLDAIQSDPVRNQIIVTCIIDNLSSSGIVYCNRRRHVELLYNTVLRSLTSPTTSAIVKDLVSDNISIVFSIANKKYIVMKGDAEHSDIHWKIKSLNDYTNFILITTVQFCACGLDLPSINVIILALTTIDDNTLKQAVGRAERSPYEGKRKVYLFCTTQNTGIERSKKSLTVKQLACANHPNIQYTNLYNKFLRDYKSIKTQLSSIGWNDTNRKTISRR